MTERETDWTAARYARSAREEHAVPGHARWASRVASDPDVLALLTALPRSKRQPNLLFAVLRHLDAPDRDWSALRAFLLDRRGPVADELARRTVQTNEPGRAAVLLPALGVGPEPIALVELGAAAGLTLIPDRYAYRFGAAPVLGGAPLVLGVRVTGDAPVPPALPRIGWRAGIDLHPLSVTDADDVRWLEALVRPGEPARLARLRAAVRIAVADPPRILAGDAAAALPGLLAEAPPGMPVVVWTAGVLVYLDPAHRRRVIDAIRGSGARWIALEAAGVVAGTPTTAPPIRFELSVDGCVVAEAGPHGDFLTWRR